MSKPIETCDEVRAVIYDDRKSRHVVGQGGVESINYFHGTSGHWVEVLILLLGLEIKEERRLIFDIDEVIKDDWETNKES